MRNAPKVVREVGVDDVRVTPQQPLVHFYDGLLGISPGAQRLNVYVDFPLLQRLGLPITVGAVRYPASGSTTPASSASRPPE